LPGQTRGGVEFRVLRFLWPGRVAAYGGHPDWRTAVSGFLVLDECRLLAHLWRSAPRSEGSAWVGSRSSNMRLDGGVRLQRGNHRLAILLQTRETAFAPLCCPDRRLPRQAVGARPPPAIGR